MVMDELHTCIIMLANANYNDVDETNIVCCMNFVHE